MGQGIHRITKDNLLPCAIYTPVFNQYIPLKYFQRKRINPLEYDTYSQYAWRECRSFTKWVSQLNESYYTIILGDNWNLKNPNAENYRNYLKKHYKAGNIRLCQVNYRVLIISDDDGHHEYLYPYFKTN